MAKQRLLHYTSFVGQPTAEAYMRRYKFVLLLIVILFILSAFISYSQSQLPRIAVMPFSAINTSKSDADAIASLFETGLVKTEAFNVIEQRQMDEILKVQEFSLSDCSSDECAVKVGQLLSAEQIVVGLLASIGGKFVLSAKIVDVTKGVSLKADKIETGSLAEMTEGAEVLAYKLAGLTYQREGPTDTLPGFADVFVESEPTGADVYVNGVNKGSSPLLVNKVPMGFVRIVCRKGNLYATEMVRITQGGTRIVLKLAQQSGSLYVRSSNYAVEVFMDGELVGKLGSGLFESIPVGRHKVELKGWGLYWADEVTIQLGTITQVEATPRACGSISYSLPQNVRAEIKGELFRKTIEGEGTLTPVWEGKYTVQTESVIYEPYSGEVDIAQGKVITFSPTLYFTREYENQQLSRFLEDIEKQLTGDYMISQSDIDRLVGIQSKIESSRHQHPELVAKSKLLRERAKQLQENQQRLERLASVNKEISSLADRKADLQNRLHKQTAVRKNFNTLAWISLGGGILSSGFGFLAYFVADAAYENYIQTSSTSEAAMYKIKVQTWDTLMLVGAGVGLTGFGTATILFLSRPNLQKTTDELLDIELKVNQLQESLR
jgi:TolB-like protein